MAWNGTVLNKGAIPNPGRSACRRGPAEDSTAVSIFVVILVDLTNTETAVVSPPRALLN